MSFANLGDFQPLSLWMLFQSCPFLLCFWDSEDRNVRFLFHRPLRLYLFSYSHLFLSVFHAGLFLSFYLQVYWFFSLFPPGKLFIFMGFFGEIKINFGLQVIHFTLPIMKVRKLKALRNNLSVQKWCWCSPNVPVWTFYKSWPLFADINLKITHRRHRAIVRNGFPAGGPRQAHMPTEGTRG